MRGDAPSSPPSQMGEYGAAGRGPLAAGERNDARATLNSSALPRGPLPPSGYSPTLRVGERRALAPLALLALLLSACAVGPAYHPPATAPVTPAAFTEASAATSPAPPPGAWWKLYDDPALDDLVRQALVANTDLRQAAASLAQARGALEEARAGLFPSTGLATAASYGRSSTVSGAASTAASSTASSGSASTAGGASTGGGAAGGTQTGGGVTGGGSTNPKARWTYSAALDASYEVDLFGRIRRGIEAARADVEAQAAARDLARTSVAAETTRAYVNACAYAQEADVARQSLDLVSQSYAITLRQRDLGSASDYEVANARTLVEQVRATLPPLEGQRRAALYSLAVLTGRPPEAVSPAAAACRKPPKLLAVVPVGDGAGLLARAPTCARPSGSWPPPRLGSGSRPPTSIRPSPWAGSSRRRGTGSATWARARARRSAWAP